MTRVWNVTLQITEYIPEQEEQELDDLMNCIIDTPWWLDLQYDEMTTSDMITSKERFLQTITRTYYAQIETTCGPLYLAYKGRTLRFVSLEDEATFLEKACSFLGVTPEWNVRLHLPLDVLHQVKTSVERQIIYEGSLDYSLLTPFQRSVLEYVRSIPPRETRTYTDIARAIGDPRARGAIAKFLMRNPFPVVVPCHRVMPANGSIGNYGSGGPEVKKRLLQLEGISVDEQDYVVRERYRPSPLPMPLYDTDSVLPEAFSVPGPWLTIGMGVTQPPCKKTMVNYLNWLVDRYDVIRVQGVLPYIDHVQLLDIYSPPRVHIDVVQQKQTAAIEKGDIFISSPTKVQTKPAHKEYRLSDVIRDNDHIILLGPPGAGKTMTLRYLALTHARKLQTSYDQGLDDAEALLPIPLQFSDLAQYLDGRTSCSSLLEFLVGYFTEHGCFSEGLAELLETSFEQGRCLILLDGLDEVSDYAQLNLAQRLNSFVAKHHHLRNHFVITCCTTAYHHNLSRPFIHCTVQGMNKEDISRFLQQWEMVLALGKVQHMELLPSLQDQQEKVPQQNLHDVWLRIIRMTRSRIVRDNPGSRLVPITPLLVQIVIIVYYDVACRLDQSSQLSKLVSNTVKQAFSTHRHLPRSARNEYLTSLLSKIVYKQYLDRHAKICSEQPDCLHQPHLTKGDTSMEVTQDPRCATACLYPSTAIEEVVQVIRNGWSAPDGPLGKDNPDTKLREDVNELLVALGEDSPDTKLREDANELLIALREQTDLIILPTRRILEPMG